MKITKKTQSRRAFTLIELLVVIAIISLLVSILLPSLNRAKDLAKQVVCSSNMRNLGLAFSMYLNDYNSWFPQIRDANLPTTGYWADKLYNSSVHDVNAFNCPTVPDRIFIAPNEPNGANAIAYGMEWFLGGGPTVGNTHQITDVEQPSDTVLLGENDNDHHGYGVHAHPTAPWGWPDDERHNGVSNILFVDNHGGPYTQFDAFDELVWFGPLD